MALYVSTGLKWVNTCVPSIPSHQNVWCGKAFVSFQLSFCVKNQRHSPWATICGNDPGYPKSSGKNAPEHVTPNHSRNARWPCTSWRNKLSPDGKLRSVSTHMPPTTSQRPSRTSSVTRAKMSGASSATHA